MGRRNRGFSTPNGSSWGSVGKVSLLSDLRLCEISRLLIYSLIDNIIQQCCLYLTSYLHGSVFYLYTHSSCDLGTHYNTVYSNNWNRFAKNPKSNKQVYILYLCLKTVYLLKWINSSYYMTVAIVTESNIYSTE